MSIQFQASGLRLHTQLNTFGNRFVYKEARQITRRHLSRRTTAANRTRRNEHLRVQPVNLWARARTPARVETQLVRLTLVIVCRKAYLNFTVAPTFSSIVLLCELTVQLKAERCKACSRRSVTVKG